MSDAVDSLIDAIEAALIGARREVETMAEAVRAQDFDTLSGARDRALQLLQEGQQEISRWRVFVRK